MAEEDVEQTILGIVNTDKFETNNEAVSYLKNLSLQIENLPHFDNVLFQLKASQIAAIVSMTGVQFLAKRGCLLSIETLQAHLESLSNLMKQKSLEISQNEQFRNIFARYFAVSYRFLLYATLQVGSPIFFDFIFEQLHGDASDQLIALATLSSVVEDIKTQQYRLLDTQHLEFRTFFYKNMLRQYFECTFQFLDSVEGLCIIPALNLLLNCLKFTTHHDDMLTFKFNVPGDWVDFYTDPTFPEKLFNIYAKSSTRSAANKALDALLYFCSAVDSTWKALDQHIAFIKTIASHMTAAITQYSPQVTEMPRKADLEFSRLICKIGMVLPLQHFITDGSAGEFFEAVKQYTEEHFNSIQFDESSNSLQICTYMLTFWGRTAAICSVSPQSYTPEFLGTFSTIFDMFVSLYLDAVMKCIDIESIFQDSQMDQNLQNFEPLWNLALISPNDCISILSEKVGEAIPVLEGGGELVPSAIIRLAILVLMIASRFSIRSIGYYKTVSMNPEIASQKASLIRSVFDILAHTSGDFLVNLIQNFPEQTSFLEQCIIAFAKTYKRDMFDSNKPEVKAVYDALGDYINCKIAFDTFVNRFIDDLNIFQINYNVRYQALLYIDDISQARQFKDLSQGNERIQSLITRSIIISLDEFDATNDDLINNQKKLITLLNTIYARNITSIDGLKVFLSYIDHKFQDLSRENPPYSNPIAVFVIFCEIRGILKGCSQIQNFVHAARWYLNQYVDTAVNCIKIHSVYPEIVKTIVRSWNCIASDKGRKLIFPHKSVDGIRVFKASLAIIKAVLENVEDTSTQASLVTLINYSLTQTYCNFGVMEFFGDTAQHEMVNTFYQLLINAGNDMDQPKQKDAIVTSIGETVKHFGASVFSEDSYKQILMSYLKFILQADPKDSKESNEADLWKKACSAVEKILLFAQSDESANSLADDVRPHFICILHHIINSAASLVDAACNPFYLMSIQESDFVAEVFQQIVQSFDPENGAKVNDIVQKFLASIPTDNPPLIAPKPFKYALSQFKIEMIRFPISVLDIEAFAEFFTE